MISRRQNRKKLSLVTVGGLACTLLALTGTLGCGGGAKSQPTGQVSGTVTYRGKPLTKARVALNDPSRGLGALADLDDAGRFTVAGPLPTGKYIVFIEPPHGLSPLEAATKGVQDAPLDIPPKYTAEQTSDLSVEVKPGKNDFPLEIKE